MKDVPEILLVDKPKGITSFGVVYTIRKKLSVEDVGSTGKSSVKEDKNKKRLKVGHAGTLDPLATGLMIIGAGKGTKRLQDYIKLDKEYIAEIRLGEQRSTGDLEGDIVAAKEVTIKDVSQKKIESAVAYLIGTHQLPVSAYSAIKKDGKPMYKRAREAEKKGEVITDVPMRDMTIYEVEVLDMKDIIVDSKKRVVVTVRFKVASGVYIRSLAEELGRKLGCPATLQNLRRTKVGEFSIEDAQPLSDFE